MHAKEERLTLNAPGDNFVMPFQLDSSGARGRLIKLGSVVDDILTRHSYPEAVLSLLGEAIALTGMLGTSLKLDGKFILQTQSDGHVSFLVAHYASPGHLRAYASHSLSSVEGAQDGLPLLGRGHLAMTVDPGAGLERYQGIVALKGDTLSEAAHEYFAQSEQIPTFIRIAVARHFTGANGASAGRWSWRAGGLMVQKLAQGSGRPKGVEITAPKAGAATSDEAEGWRRAHALAATVEDHELLDPSLPPDRLLYRLFHEEGVRAFDGTLLDAVCQCSRQAVKDMLDRFSPEELHDMVDGGMITVTCQFCNTSYAFAADDYLPQAD